MTNRVVLLVEDNERNLKLARDVLEYAGFTDLEITVYGGPFSFLHHQASFLIPGLVTGVPLLGSAAIAINAAFSWLFAGIDRIPLLHRLLPLGVLAIARTPA